MSLRRSPAPPGGRLIDPRTSLEGAYLGRLLKPLPT